MSHTSLWKTALAAVASYLSFKALSWYISIFRSPLRQLQGPPSPSFVFGHLNEVRSVDDGIIYGWPKCYGSVMRVKTFFGGYSLYTSDTRALNHILTHSQDYQKPQRDRSIGLLGDGVLFAEGEKHRKQRRIMNPTFGPAAIKDLVPVFLSKSFELVDCLRSQIAVEGSLKEVDVLSWLSRATLDIIGMAGFDYQFDSLNPHGEPNELSEAFQNLFKGTAGFHRLLFILGNFVPGIDPIIRFLPSQRRKRVREARDTMTRIGTKLLTDRKAAALGKTNAADSSLQKLSLEGHDLLSALISANMDTSIPESQRMSDMDVLDQVPTFLVAGHETTSTETTWCLYELARSSKLQTRLRTELLALSDTPSADELNELPFLDAIVRETLRFHAAVPNSFRIAMRDDVIPVHEPFVDRYGNKQTEIRIQKGDPIFLPLYAMNRSKSIWGPDADQFNPERWTSVPETAKDIPGVWGHIMTFLGGSRSCIGYRFALYEMKALIFAIVRAFEFELTVPPEAIGTVSTIVTRPILKDDKGAGSQLPLRLTLIKVDGVESSN